MTKILFTKAHCLCHDVNQVTKSANHIDVIMGFSTGEIIWWEATSQRYARLNKNVSEVKIASKGLELTATGRDKRDARVPD